MTDSAESSVKPAAASERPTISGLRMIMTWVVSELEDPSMDWNRLLLLEAPLATLSGCPPCCKTSRRAEAW